MPKHDSERLAGSRHSDPFVASDTDLFIDVRHFDYQQEIIEPIEGLTGQVWNPANHCYGRLKTPADVERCHPEATRLVVQLLTIRTKWAGTEQDDRGGQALPEHSEAHEGRAARSEFSYITSRLEYRSFMVER